MTIKKEEKASEVTLFVEGRLDTLTSPELEKEILELKDAESLIIDFSKLEYISSSGLRILLSAHKLFSKKGGMIIRECNDVIMDIFDVTGFKDILNIN